ncbi:hypothetical protein HK104_007155 [Borealophlyctis nickersoniae]|nr:hypothetical protein HK104_007155 [Borealophlyctis nickersoniae]
MGGFAPWYNATKIPMVHVPVDAREKREAVAKRRVGAPDGVYQPITPPTTSNDMAAAEALLSLHAGQNQPPTLSYNYYSGYGYTTRPFGL